MRTAIDTNIVSGLWSKEPTSGLIIQRLREARQAGAIVITGIVYSELLAYPGATKDFLGNFLDKTEIMVDFDTGEALWAETGSRFARYALRRRKSQGEEPKRMLADFVIGAHALLKADSLMTLDTSRYRQDFPELHLYP